MANTVTVTFDERAIRRWTQDLDRQIQRRVVARALDRVAQEVTFNVIRDAPVDTGRLRRSIRYRLDTRDTLAYLYVLEDAAYWRYLNYGTVYIPAGPFVSVQLRTVDQVIYEAVRDAFADFVRGVSIGTIRIF